MFRGLTAGATCCLPTIVRNGITDTVIKVLAVLALALTGCTQTIESRYCNDQKPDPKDPSRPATDCTSKVVKGSHPDAVPATIGK